MAGFEHGHSGVGSDRYANCATTNDRNLCMKKYFNSTFAIRHCHFYFAKLHFKLFSFPTRHSKYVSAESGSTEDSLRCSAGWSH